MIPHKTNSTDAPRVPRNLRGAHGAAGRASGRGRPLSLNKHRYSGLFIRRQHASLARCVIQDNIFHISGRASERESQLHQLDADDRTSCPVRPSFNRSWCGGDRRGSCRYQLAREERRGERERKERGREERDKERRVNAAEGDSRSVPLLEFRASARFDEWVGRGRWVGRMDPA